MSHFHGSFTLAWLPGLTLLLGAGCGNPLVSYSCDPACPSGMHCGVGGCEADNPASDSAVPPPLDLALTCSPGCSGSTPFCDTNNNCVVCLVDSDCPLGLQCQKLGALPQCIAGCADDSRCAAGMKCCDHACTDTSSDAYNCGACAQVCQVPHAPSSCQSGACTMGVCAAGWGDCNAEATDGCETNLALDSQNCGHCGGTCDLPNAAAACSSGCYLAACQFGWGDCNQVLEDGCEMSVLADIRNCGGCGNSCQSAPHSSPACRNGSCQLASCAQGFADCDGSPDNGCEVATGTDKLNCGQCGNQCPMGLVCRNSACTCPNCNFPNAKSKCFNNQCVMGDCLAGWADCNMIAKDGCEADTTSDTSHCGACQTVCAQGEVCDAGMCKLIQCMRLGWKFGKDNWDCPQGLQMPTVNDYDNVLPCIEQGDLGMFGNMNDIAVSVGGCNCKWNGNWCGQPSIETMRQGRACGDYAQLHICIN